jgi:hypothetical protein
MEKAPYYFKVGINIIICLRKSSKKIKGFHSGTPTGQKDVSSSEAEFIRRSSFRNVFMFDSALIPFAGNIQIAIATAILTDILRPVLAGADNIGILFPGACRQAAGTAHITVTFLVDQKVGQYAQNPYLVFIKEKALGFLNLFHHFVEFGWSH